MAPYGTNFHQLPPYGTIQYHMANRAQDGCWKRYTRTHISDSLILFPKDQIISFIQLHYKASQLATLCRILWALLDSLQTSSLIHLFTCLSLTHWLSDIDLLCPYTNHTPCRNKTLHALYPILPYNSHYLSQLRLFQAFLGTSCNTHQPPKKKYNTAKHEIIHPHPIHCCASNPCPPPWQRYCAQLQTEPCWGACMETGIWWRTRELECPRLRWYEVLVLEG